MIIKKIITMIILPTAIMSPILANAQSPGTLPPNVDLQKKYDLCIQDNNTKIDYDLAYLNVMRENDLALLENRNKSEYIDMEFRRDFESRKFDRSVELDKERLKLEYETKRKLLSLKLNYLPTTISKEARAQMTEKVEDQQRILSLELEKNFERADAQREKFLVQTRLSFENSMKSLKDSNRKREEQIFLGFKQAEKKIMSMKELVGKKCSEILNVSKKQQPTSKKVPPTVSTSPSVVTNEGLIK